MGSNFSERLKGETTRVHLGMRDGQFFRLNGCVSVKKNIDVDDPRTLLLMRIAHTAKSRSILSKPASRSFGAS